MKITVLEIRWIKLMQPESCSTRKKMKCSKKESSTRYLSYFQDSASPYFATCHFDTTFPIWLNCINNQPYYLLVSTVPSKTYEVIVWCWHQRPNNSPFGYSLVFKISNNICHISGHRKFKKWWKQRLKNTPFFMLVIL